MTARITHIFSRIFQPKQILIRRSGHVSTWHVSRAVQWFMLFLFLATTVWTTISTRGFFDKTAVIESITAEGHSNTSKWLEEKQKLEATIAEQQAQLTNLQQKQTLLQEVVDSLPSSLTQTSTESVATLDTNPELTTEHAVEEAALTQEELLNLPDVHPAEAQEPVQLSVPDAPQEEKQLDESLSLPPFAMQVDTLDEQLQQFRDRLAMQIESRQENIKTSLSEAGVLSATQSTEAQGGPLHQVEDDTLPVDYLQLADELVKLNELEQVVAKLPSSLPAENYYISSNYGLRKDPMTGQRAFHKGVDLAGWHKTRIFAPADGTVVRAGRNGGYGNFIELQHANGVKTRFGHLHTIKVEKGQQVTKQDVIALMGSTGRSTSTHLHYEVLHNDKHINPIKLTKALSSVQ